MKKLLTIALVSAFTISSFAQRNMNDKTARYTPEQMAELKVKQMALRLDLNKSQQSKMQDLLEKGIKHRQEAMQARKNAKSEENTKDRPDRFNRQIALLDQKLAFQTEVKNILSESQYTQWKKEQSRPFGKKFKRGQRGNKNFSGRRNHFNRNRFALKRMQMKRSQMNRQHPMKQQMNGHRKMQNEHKDKKELNEEK
ncbi:hypothetical protein MWU59_03800 [Flavobacteriaceae bacterium F08102]|nr:hypothetical protein [Flavobacteriaceae bacterium F08102]